MAILLVLVVLLALKDLKVSKGRQGHRDSKDPQGYRDSKDPQGYRDSKDPQGYRDLDLMRYLIQPTTGFLHQMEQQMQLLPSPTFLLMEILYI
jgi:hypothetical protein